MVEGIGQPPHLIAGNHVHPLGIVAVGNFPGNGGYLEQGTEHPAGHQVHDQQGQRQGGHCPPDEIVANGVQKPVVRLQGSAGGAPDRLIVGGGGPVDLPPDHVGDPPEDRHDMPDEELPEEPLPHPSSTEGALSSLKR